MFIVGADGVEGVVTRAIDRVNEINRRKEIAPKYAVT